MSNGHIQHGSVQAGDTAKSPASKTTPKKEATPKATDAKK